MAAVAVACASLVGLFAQGAHAADIPGAVTSIATDKIEYAYGESVKLTFAWAVPDSAVAGDSFSIDLPPELLPVSTATIVLRAPDGALVATGIWSGSHVEFFLTDYVESHTDVSGTGYFSSDWNYSEIGTEGKGLDLSINGFVIHVDVDPQGDPGVHPIDEPFGKYATWNDSDQGESHPVDAISWKINLPSSSSGFAGPLTLTDTPSAGSSIDCTDKLGNLYFTSWVDLDNGIDSFPISWSRVSNFTCTPQGFSFDLDSIQPNEHLVFYYLGSIDTPGLSTYGNTAKLTSPDTNLKTKTSIARSDAGGDGSGTTPTAPPVEPTEEPTAPPIEPTEEPTTPQAPPTEPTEVPTATPEPFIAPTTPPAATLPAAGSNPPGPVATLPSTGSDGAPSMIAAAVTLTGVGIAMLIVLARRRTARR